MLYTSILIGIGLSMDAFSLSILYGTLSFSKKKILLLSSFVGLFHFLMPLLGYMFGSYLFSYLAINTHALVGAILGIIAIEMLLSVKKEEQLTNLTTISSLLLFAFTVSIDSFSVGIGLSGLTDQILMSALIYALLSGMFTLLGLSIGKNLNRLFGKLSTIVGAMILLILSIYYFFS